MRPPDEEIGGVWLPRIEKKHSVAIRVILVEEPNDDVCPKQSIDSALQRVFVSTAAPANRPGFLVAKEAERIDDFLFLQR